MATPKPKDDDAPAALDTDIKLNDGRSLRKGARVPAAKVAELTTKPTEQPEPKAEASEPAPAAKPAPKAPATAKTGDKS